MSRCDDWHRAARRSDGSAPTTSIMGAVRARNSKVTHRGFREPRILWMSTPFVRGARNQSWRYRATAPPHRPSDGRGLRGSPLATGCSSIGSVSNPPQPHTESRRTGCNLEQKGSFLDYVGPERSTGPGVTGEARLRQVYSLLRTILNAAVKDHLITETPARSKGSGRSTIRSALTSRRSTWSPLLGQCRGSGACLSAWPSEHTCGSSASASTFEFRAPSPPREDEGSPHGGALAEHRRGG